MTPQSLPYQLIVILTYPHGHTEVFGMFDTDEEAWEYVEHCKALGDLPENITYTTQLLIPK